jgi:thiamine-monophosphate kinase
VTSAARDEAAWIAFIAHLWGTSDAKVGPGDDGCVLPSGSYTLTTDTLLEGVDFEREWAPPQAVGYKAMAANLSDLAAMGATPRFLLMTLAVPEAVPEKYVEGVVEGIRALGVAEGVGLVGGDLSSSKSGLVISLTLAGAQEAAPLLRSGGKPGDVLFLSGPIGGPAAALRRFQSGGRLGTFEFGTRPPAPEQALLDRFYRPPGQTGLGIRLASDRLASCCMDVSDGLMKDLARMCEASGCGAEIEARSLPLDPLLGVQDEDRELENALRGGEEQVLLFAVPRRLASEVEVKCAGVRAIGRLVEGDRRVLVLPGDRREELPANGFDHFAS